jgi:hypothetical protein
MGKTPMSMRKILNLWKHLPNDSAVSRAIDSEGFLQTRWTTTDHLLALMSEQLDALSYMYVQTHSKNKPKWKPVQHNRPKKPDMFNVAPKKKRNANAVEVKAILRGEL